MNCTVRVARTGAVSILFTAALAGRLAAQPVELRAVTLERRATEIRHIWFSPQGRLVAADCQDRVIRVWDAQTGKLKAQLECDSRLSSLAISPDGRTLAAGFSDNTVRAWEIETGKLSRTLPHPKGPVTDVSWSPDGMMLASVCSDKAVLVWDPHSGMLLRTLTGQGVGMRRVAFSPDGRILASSGTGARAESGTAMGAEISLWDAHTGALLRTLPNHRFLGLSLDFSPDGKLLAIQRSDMALQLWDVHTGQLRGTLRGVGRLPVSVAFSSDGRTLATGGHNRTVRLWDLGTRELKGMMVLSERDGQGTPLAFGDNGQALITCSPDGTLVYWDVTTFALCASLDGLGRLLAGHEGAVHSVMFSPDGKTLASGSADKTARLWHVQTGALARTLTQHGNEVLCVAFSPDGHVLATGSQDNAIRLWDLGTGKMQRLLAGHRAEVRSVVFASDGRTLASGSPDNSVRFWDVHTGELRRTLTSSPQPGARPFSSALIGPVAISTDRRTVTAPCWDDAVRVWDAHTGVLKQTLKCESYSLAFAFSPDNAALACGRQNGGVILCDALRGDCTLTFKGFDGPVYAVAFSPDGRTLATGGATKIDAYGLVSGGEVRLWDARTGQLKAKVVPEPSTAHVTSVAFSPDGRNLASGCWDGMVQIWDVSNLTR